MLLLISFLFSCTSFDAELNKSLSYRLNIRPIVWSIRFLAALLKLDCGMKALISLGLTVCRPGLHFVFDFSESEPKASTALF